MQAGISNEPTRTQHLRPLCTSRRISGSTVVAAGVVAAMFAGAGPAAAINPGGGRHRVHAEQARHASARKHSHESGDSMSPELKRDFYRLRLCESSNNYRDNTGNGYYGAYQFALQTWHNLGMSGRPDQAAPDLQDHAAYVLYSHAGWSPWPACSQREHLR
ncbi:MAG TPA: transglycosylase family protein [Mycobacteriales bacterium]|nr:transglycosylase family protein [Mycobacteriales bacterium]